ncbi:hypothetical protein ASF71_13035 [Deinococcus sp. Leaf326]|nr:hypothetical protein ASF71_13035 [Deinococcus sp. Leaf326]
MTGLKTGNDGWEFCLDQADSDIKSSTDFLSHVYIEPDESPGRTRLREWWVLAAHDNTQFATLLDI